jgi:DNA-binding transcriptional MerR regulator
MQIESPLHRGSGANDSSCGATLAIQDVSALLAVPAPTIRSWERRQALPGVTRDEHGHRRYTDDDVAVLRRMRDRRALGVSVAAAAAAATAPPPLALCRQLLAAVDRLDGDEIAAVLDSSLDAHGLPVTLDEVLLPSMREVGAQWSRGRCDVAQEHLATGAVLAWLARRAAQVPPALPGRPVVLACGPQDQHTISLEAFSLLLREQRFDCRNLGAQTPAASLRHAVEQCSARAVILVSQLRRNRPAAVSALRAVSDSGAVLFYAGAAFRTTASRQKLPGYYLGGNLSRAAAHITTQLRPT